VQQLTNIQVRLLAALRQRIERGEPPPSYRDLCSEFGWRSTGTARDHLRALARKGYLDLPGRRAGRVQLRSGVAPVANVPIVGRVTAGIPVLTEQEVEGMLPIPADWAVQGEYFALRVTGDSMRDAGILEGDHIVVRRQSSATRGDIVAVTVDGETTLKRLEESGARLVLVAENPRYRPIELKSESVVIHGVVVGLLRAYCAGGVPRRFQQPIGSRLQKRSPHGHEA
jgi:repressor LexA